MDKERVYSCAKEIAMRLKEYRKYGKASLMVGAGFSKNAKSKGSKNIQPPDWKELADKMYCELYPEIPNIDDRQKKDWENQRIIKRSGKNVTKLAEEYIVNFDRNTMNHLIENSIADDLFMPGELHKRLLRLPWGDIFTTNYDTLLEQTADMIFRESGYQIICSQNDIPGSIRPRIVKLHGSIPHVKPYIISDEDYRTYPVKHAPMVNTVQQAMLETRLCLIGFSGDDPNFQNWMGWLRDNMGECCPMIYLIGIYDKLSAAEKKLLESKQIMIVDISCLVGENVADRHSAAISEFLSLLENYYKEEDVFSDNPYKDAYKGWDQDDQETFIKKSGEYSRKVLKHIQPYILLPENIRETCENIFTEYFEILIRRCKEQPPVAVIADIIKILRKCSIALERVDAECLEEICGSSCDITVIKKDELDALIEICLYLAEMYRLDNSKAEYEEKILLLEKLVGKMPWYKNELIIEKTKNKIERFEYEKARALVEEIEENSFEYKIKKAGFCKQLSEYELADRILGECSSELAQMKIPEDVYASYLGYLNLCYRVNKYVDSDEFSDADYFENTYNTRQILIKQRDDLSQKFFEMDRKEDERILPFNLNTGKNIIYSIGSRGVYRKGLRYLVTLDKLCLPLFRDLGSLLPRVYNEVMESNICSQWKMSFIARSNNDKLIEQIFTRETIGAVCKDDVNSLFQELIALADLYKLDDYFWKKYLISLKNILNILSRLVIFMPDENVIQYLKLLSKVSRNNDCRTKKDIDNILRRISTRFNSDIAVACQEIIFKEFGVSFHLASYFERFSFIINTENVQDYYHYAIQLAGEKDMVKRDCGVSQLLLLWKNYKIYDLGEIIKEVLWSNDKLPHSEICFPFIWEELPYPDTVNFSELYYEYLMNDRYLTSVTEFGVVRNDSLNSVLIYLKFFYATLRISKRKIEKVLLDERLAVFMLDTAYNYILHEEKLLYNEFEKSGAEEKFEYIGELVALVYMEALDRGFVDEISEKIDAVWQLLDKNQIVVDAIKMINWIGKGRYSMCTELFENVVLSKNKKNYSSVFAGMKCLIYYLENKEEGNAILDSFFERFLSTIKYLDIEYAKTVWLELVSLFTQEFFTGKKIQKYVSSAIRKCIELYQEPSQKGRRFYMDGLYNCINALQCYYKCVKESPTEMTQELIDCVSKAKAIENLEIRNIWR